MMFALGLVVGLLIAVLHVVIHTQHRTTVERTVNKFRSAIKPKGKIIEMEEEGDVNEWLGGLPKE